MIVTDMGKEFTSNTFQNFCDTNDINLHFVSPYHHASNGLVERLNLQIENCIRCCLIDNKKCWDTYVDKIAQSLNSTVHGATGYTPHEIIHNRSMDVNLVGLNNVNNVDTDIDSLHYKVKDNIIKSGQNLRSRFNVFKRNRNFVVNDYVYVKVSERSNKLKPLYNGPFRIVGVDDSGFSYNILDDQKGVVYSVHINNIR